MQIAWNYWQHFNQATTHRYVFRYRGDNVCLTELARRTGKSREVLKRRIIDHGMSVEDAINLKSLPKGGKKPKLYWFRGERRSLKEIAALAGVCEVTAWQRRCGDRVLEAHEIDRADCGGKQLRLGFQSKTVRQWAKEVGITPQALYGRLDAGWPLAKALFTPARQRHV
jgi:AraC-like DNA-binding protein